MYEYEFFKNVPDIETEMKVKWFCSICKDELNNDKREASDLIAKQSTKIDFLSQQVKLVQ